MRDRQRRIMVGLLLLTMIGVGSGADAQDGAAIKARRDLSVVPRADRWSLVPPEERPALQAIAATKAAERDRLVLEGNARERGIGIFIADQQGDIAALLKWKHLLNDEEVTIPYALPLAQPEEYAAGDQTVAEYLNSVYHDWLGVNLNQSVKRFDKIVGTIEEPRHLAYPWVVRLMRARGDEKRLKALKAEIETLPETTRWAVITIGWSNSAYTREEARRLLGNMSPDLKTRLRSDNPDLLPEEPLFRASKSYRGAVLEKCRELVN